MSIESDITYLWKEIKKLQEEIKHLKKSIEQTKNATMINYPNYKNCG